MNKAEQERLYEAEREAARVARNASRPRTLDPRPARVLAHTADMETSHEAAAANPEGRATNMLACLRAHEQHPGGLTDDEVRTFTGLPDIEANRRCTDLRKHKPPLIEFADPPRRRKTRSGRNARVCVLTQAGREEL